MPSEELKKNSCSRHKRQNIRSTAKALTYQNEQKAKKFKMAKIYPNSSNKVKCNVKAYQRKRNLLEVK